ncbi:MAG: alanine racemase [Proteobacteria bacterium]|nr:alanine racemase [Pseudomonadota bacterium]
MTIPPPHRLRLDGAALVANWLWLKNQGGSAACGAAVKADGYGLGAREVVARLAAAGCRDFFTATWAEAEALMPLPEGARLSVLHGVRAEDMAAARTLDARPVLNSIEQLMRWRDANGGACDVMIDTGINRLGLPPADWAALEGLEIDTLMSHLACADEDSARNAAQHKAFVEVAGRVPHRRLSLANSAGICLGADYAFDLTRPGLALYGGVPRDEALGHIRQVAFPEAQILQRRIAPAGESVGYNGIWTAECDTEIAILNIGYGDGILRGFSNRGTASTEGRTLPFIGRVSMDLIAIDITAAPELGEGDWVTIDYALPEASAASGIAQYELLTSLGRRFERYWVD